ncbi:MAG: cysteine hydrolase [Rhodobacteraceae bacterium]|nr:cysteine hydrolase [Paracoccaceae bacterium]
MTKTALLVLDMINEVIHENGKFAGMGMPAQVKERNVLANTSAAITKARAKGIPVIFVRVGFSADYRECPEGSPLLGAAKEYGALQLNDWATEIHEDIDQRPEDFQVTKHRVSAFHGTSLDLILKRIGADTLLMGGVATDLVVQTTARDAHDKDFKVVILEDCCAAGSAETHDNVIAMLGAIGRVETSTSAKELN